MSEPKSLSDRYEPILADMKMISEQVDESVGTSEYQVHLVSLALVARHFLREVGDELAAAVRAALLPTPKE